MPIVINIFISELRKESRQLENEIDVKLVSFSKLSSGFLRRDARLESMLQT